MARPVSSSIPCCTRHFPQTRYALRAPVPGAPSVHSLPDPEGTDPAFVYLLSRHGTRFPTLDRMTEMDGLEALFRDARARKAYPWTHGWRSPYADPLARFANGELHPLGEGEMFGLAERLRSR